MRGLRRQRPLPTHGGHPRHLPLSHMTDCRLLGLQPMRRVLMMLDVTEAEAEHIVEALGPCRLTSKKTVCRGRSIKLDLPRLKTREVSSFRYAPEQAGSLAGRTRALRIKKSAERARMRMSTFHPEGTFPSLDKRAGHGGEMMISWHILGRHLITSSISNLAR